MPPTALADDQPDVEPVISNDPEHRYCVVCGNRGGPWRSPKAVRCKDCDKAAAEDRKAWAREYHAARARAVSRLVKKYHAEFEEMVRHERANPPEEEPGAPV